MVEKFVEGDVGGIQMFKVLSVREIFSYFFQIFKNYEWKLQVLVAGGCGQRCLINFQMGDLDRVSIKFFRRGTWMGIIAKFSEGGNGLGGMSKTQNKVRIGQKNVQMLIKSEI